MTEIKGAYCWIPSLYFMQALPYGLITMLAPVLYKNFDVDNTTIAFYTSLLTLPWLFKPLISPLLETLASKRSLILITQFIIGILALLLALSFALNNFLLATGIIFFIIAIFSSAFDINSDGLYIAGLSKNTQAYFVGIRVWFYQLGKLTCQGGLVFLAGYFINYLSKQHAWQATLILFSVLIFLIAFYHQRTLPVLENDNAHKKHLAQKGLGSFKNIFTELANLPHMWAIITFALIYNIAEAQLMKIAPLFLLDNINQGGLALTVKEVGTLYGIVSMLGMLLGALLSGFILARTTLKLCLVPMTIFVGVTNIVYLLMSMGIGHSTWIIGGFLAIAQFSYGLSNSAYMLYLLNNFAKGDYAMSLYTIGTALMGASMLIGGAISGYIQQILGYTGFFSWILFVSFIIAGISVYNSRKVL